MVLVLWSQSVLGRSTRCPLMQNFLKYYPDDPEAQTEYIACPECPPGLGLVPQCGSKITNYTAIKCEPCQQNKTFSDHHGFESCRSCHDFGLKIVTQQCTPSQNRKCGTKCPERHYLDDNGFCQECYFCCPSVDETGRMKKCKDIGMGEDWQCLKNHQNKLCKEALENSTEASVDTIDTTAVTLLPGHNFEANKAESTSYDNVRKPSASSENVTSDGDITPSIIVGMIMILIALVLIVALYRFKRIMSCRNGSALNPEGKRESCLATLLLSFLRVASQALNSC